jgi:phosphonate transport system ATP-binding protein
VPPLPPRQRVVTAVLAGRLPAMGLWPACARCSTRRHPGAHDALERFDLADKLFERVDRLSGGERQRVGLARALLAPARPVADRRAAVGTGPDARAQAMTTLVALARDRGVTLVATLHQVDMALAHFPRIIGLRDGALAFDLPAARSRASGWRACTPARTRTARRRRGAGRRRATPAPQPAVMHCR